MHLFDVIAMLASVLALVEHAAALYSRWKKHHPTSEPIS
jgi:hypothetical protein